MNHYQLQKECEKTEVKPLFGNELYCKTYYDKPAGKDRFHLVLIAQNQTGLENIRKLQRISVADHFYYKPLTPHPLIFENTEGLFCSTASALSYINDCFLKEKDDFLLKSPFSYLSVKKRRGAIICKPRLCGSLRLWL